MIMASCSSDAQYHGDFYQNSSNSEVENPGIINDNSELGDDDSEQGDDEEEITAIPPAIISGAHLVCQTETKNEEEQTIDVICYLEKDSEALQGIDLIESDFSAVDDNDDNLLQGFSKAGKRGAFNLKLNLKDGSSINISLISLGGQALSPEDFEPGILTAHISLETIEATKDVSETYVLAEIEEEESKADASETADEEPPAPDDLFIEELMEEEMVVDPGEESVVTQTNFCETITVGGAWVLVPGDPAFETGDFCIMKYEAKCPEADGRNCEPFIGLTNPTSMPDNTPWVNISQDDARAQCAALGVGFRLISNPEWMTISANASSIPGNWSGGAVGAGTLNRGHTDSLPASMCQANSNDANAYVNTTCDGEPTGSEFSQKRTHQLSNGETVWDIPGNAREWIDYNSPNDKPSPQLEGGIEYPLVAGNATIPKSHMVPTNEISPFWDDAWNSQQGIGMYFPGAQDMGGALERGGNFQSDFRAGFFSMGLQGLGDSINTSIGFRCTIAVP